MNVEITEKYLKDKMKENIACEVKMAKLKKPLYIVGFIVTAGECAAAWLIFGKTGAVVLAVSVLLLLLNFAAVIFFPVFAEYRRRSFRFSGIGEFFSRIVYSIKYGEIIRQCDTKLCPETQLEELDRALAREKNTCRRLDLMELKITVMLVRGMYFEAEREFEKLTQLAEKKKLTGGDFAETKLLYYAITEYRDAFIDTFEKNRDYIEKLIKSCFKDVLTGLQLIAYYEKFIGRYKASLEHYALFADYISRETQLRRTPESMADRLNYDKSKRCCELSELYLKNNDAAGAAELYGKAKKCAEKISCGIPYLLSECLEELKIKLKK